MQVFLMRSVSPKTNGYQNDKLKRHNLCVHALHQKNVVINFILGIQIVRGSMVKYQHVNDMNVLFTKMLYTGVL